MGNRLGEILFYLIHSVVVYQNTFFFCSGLKSTRRLRSYQDCYTYHHCSNSEMIPFRIDRKTPPGTQWPYSCPISSNLVIPQEVLPSQGQHGYYPLLFTSVMGAHKGERRSSVGVWTFGSVTISGSECESLNHSAIPSPPYDTNEDPWNH